MNNFENKISKYLEDINTLDFSTLNCIRLISLVEKIILEFQVNLINEIDSHFLHGIIQTRDKELSDLVHFTYPDDLKRLFDNVKSEIELDKNNYWNPPIK